MCDPGDLGLHVAPGGDVAGGPLAIFLHETVEEGLGLGATMFAVHDDLLARVSGAVTNCACETGCPACVGPASPAGDGLADRKTLVGALLAALRRH